MQTQRSRSTEVSQRRTNLHLLSNFLIVVQDSGVTAVNELTSMTTSQLEGRTASPRPAEILTNETSARSPKMSLRNTYLLHPSHLSFKLSLTVDRDDFKFSYEDRETKGGHADEAPGLRSVRGNMGYGFEASCYCVSDASVP